MTSFWQARVRKHQATQLKYLRLIFNDQFVIALIFLIGSLGFWYSNILKTIATEQWWAKLVIAALAMVFISVGHLATLLQTADSTFLLPKETQLAQYLRLARTYSLMIPLLTITLGAFLMYPFANIAGGMTMLQYSFYVVAMYVLKYAELELEMLELYTKRNYRWFFLAGILVAFLAALYLNHFIILLVVLVVTGYMIYQRNRLVSEQLFEWNKAIKKENARAFNIKRFYNLFTDVPGMSSKIVRRKYLDGILKLFPTNHEHTYMYIFSRGFVRNNEYLGLFLRLTIIEVAILFFVDNVYLAALIAGLFIYLVGFQLKPFYKQYVSNIMQKIYPVKVTSKAKDFQKLVVTVLLLQWFVSLIPTLYIFGLTLNTVIVAGVGLLIVLLFVYMLLPNDLKKLDE